jgi:hypothetical protein
MKRLSILITLAFIILACNLASPQPVTPPELSISSNPVTLSAYSDVTLHIHAKNTSRADWINYNLLIGYAKENSGESMISINQMPVNLPVGQSLDQDIHWKADIQDAEGTYEFRLILVDEKNIQIAATKNVFTFVNPMILLAVSTSELSSQPSVGIHVQINNQNGPTIQNMKLNLMLTKKGETSGILIQDTPVSINAGETFIHDFEWTSNVPVLEGNYDLQAVLLTDPGSILVKQASIPVSVK